MNISLIKTQSLISIQTYMLTKRILSNFISILLNNFRGIDTFPANSKYTISRLPLSAKGGGGASSSH